MTTTAQSIRNTALSIGASASRLDRALDRIEAEREEARAAIAGLREQLADAEAERDRAQRAIADVRAAVETWADVDLDTVGGDEFFQLWEATQLAVIPGEGR